MTFLNLLLNPFFIICLYIFFYKLFFIYKETSKNLPSKYYQENKERLNAQLNRAREKYQQFSKEKKIKKSDNMVVNVTKIPQKMKNRSLWSIEKILKNERKHFIIIIRKYFNLENFSCF